MRIVFYSVSVSPYGAPTSMLNLIQGLCAHGGYEVVVVVPSDGPLTKRLRELNVRIVRLPHYNWIYRAKYYRGLQAKNRLLAWAWLYKNMLQKLLMNLMVFPIHLWKVRAIDPDIVYVNASMSPVGVMVAKLLGIKSIWHHREPLNEPNTDFYLEWHPRAYRKIFNLPTVRIYNSTYLLDYFQQNVSGEYRGRVDVIFNGVPEGLNVQRQKEKRIVFGVVGKIERSGGKGQNEVMDIFNDLANEDIILHIYGGGEVAYINTLREANRGGHVNICGFRRAEQIYSEIDFLIMNSRNEAFGRVIVEAYSYGVPVIAIRSGASPEIVDEGLTGFLYDDNARLRQLIVSAVSIRNSTDYETISNACKQKYIDNFTIEKYTTDIMKVIAAETGNAEVISVGQ